MEDPKPDFNVSRLFSQLMVERGWKKQDVVNATGLPQTTISNILRGRSKQPRPVALKILAEVFDLSVEELISYGSGNSGSLLSSTVSKRSSPLMIPLIPWHDTNLWLTNQKDIKDYDTWLQNGICKSSKAFALKARASMCSLLLYPEGVLLVDPQAPMKDNVIILVFLEEAIEPSLRWLTIDGENKRIQPLEKGLPSVALTEKHTVVGVIAQIRMAPASD